MNYFNQVSDGVVHFVLEMVGDAIMPIPVRF